ncbi:MAG: NAD-dependent epimerase/dehydratase family protein [Euryarchaeota archaeon]|nr:NAD-dependent epimerase/dehydratase family protein [Euryarchaeota archaeon]
MKILVTGGAGFIGSNLVGELVRENSVVILDNLHSGSLENLKEVKNKIEIIKDSCNNISNLKLPVVDIIFHLGIPSSSPMYKQNPLLVGEAINGTISVFEYAKKVKAKKVIFASSSSLYNGNQPPHIENMEIRVTDYYTEARFCIERIAKLYNVLYGVKSAGLRFFSVYGPHEKAKGNYANMVSQFLWEMKKGKSPIIYGDGTQSRDFVFVKDVVRALILIMNLEIEHEIYNVGTGISYSFNDIIQVLNDKLNTNIKPTYIEMPIKNYVDRTLADTRKIKSIGYQTEYSIEKGIDEIISSKN